MTSEPTLKKLQLKLQGLCPTTQFTAQELLNFLEKCKMDKEEVLASEYSHMQTPICKHCGSDKVHRKKARRMENGAISRTYQCKECKSFFTTHEKIIERKPIIKET